jgi:hypothetical protein
MERQASVGEIDLMSTAADAERPKRLEGHLPVESQG